MSSAPIRCPACTHVLLTIDLPLAQAPSPGPSDGTEAPLLLRIPEAARLLGVSRPTLYQLVARREVPVVRIGHSVRVRRAEVERITG